MRLDTKFCLEPYNPHRFSRQFGYCQDVPGVATKDVRRTSLEEGLKYWRFWTATETNKRALFPLHETKFSTTRGYDEWLKGDYARCMEGNKVTPIDYPQMPRPTHGRGKELRLMQVVAGRTTPSCERSTDAATQDSSSGKRKISPIDSGSDIRDDINFKHRRVSHPTPLDNPPLEGSLFLQPTAGCLQVKPIQSCSSVLPFFLF